MSPNPIGRVILNRYRIDEFVASGGMGDVYKVWDAQRSAYLAMKILRADPTEDATEFRLFQREADVLKTLAHPNIVPFYGLEQAENFSFILEAFVDGPSLKDILSQRRVLPVPEALTYLKTLSAALGFAHAQGFVHCDVKPGNVLTDHGGNIYLTDFGIVRRASPTTSTTGLVGAGTPAYMAPEQALGMQVTPSADIYSLGVVFYELVTGQRPFSGNEPDAYTGGATVSDRIRYAHVQLPPPDPRVFNPQLPPALCQVMLYALAKRPEQRYATIGDFFNAACQGSGYRPDQVPTRLTGAVQPPFMPHQQPAPGPQYPQQTPSQQTPFGWPNAVKPLPGQTIPYPQETYPLPSEPQGMPPGTPLYPPVQPRPGHTSGGILKTILMIIGGLAVICIIAAIILLNNLRNTPSSPGRPPTAAPAITKVKDGQATTAPAVPATEAPAVSTATRAPGVTPKKPTHTTPPSINRNAILIPAGDFLMGDTQKDLAIESSPNIVSFETPAHRVTLHAFYIDLTEVTNAAFAAFVRATNYQTYAERSGGGSVYDAGSQNFPNPGNGAYWRDPDGSGKGIGGMDNYPVVQMSWSDANAFCQWAGGRLPTEAEWEKAARGADGRVYPWGDNYDGNRLNGSDKTLGQDPQYFNFNDGYAFAAPVGSYPSGASPYGVLDMAGNALEWVNDFSSKTYYSESPNTDPPGPSSGSSHILRGGSWYSGEHNNRIAHRVFAESIEVASQNYGFRCAYDH